MPRHQGSQRRLLLLIDEAAEQLSISQANTLAQEDLAQMVKHALHLASRHGPSL